MYADDADGGLLTTVYLLTLLLAGLASLLAVLEMLVHSLLDTAPRCPRSVAAAAAALLVFLVGLPSALSLDVLVGQEFCWSVSVLLSGGLLARAVSAVGVEDVRQELINNEEEGLVRGGDWALPRLWSPLVRFLAPLLAATVLLWWAVATLVLHAPWLNLGRVGSLGTCLAQWAGAAALATAISCLANKTWCARRYQRYRGHIPSAVSSVGMGDSRSSLGTVSSSSPAADGPVCPVVSRALVSIHATAATRLLGLGGNGKGGTHTAYYHVSCTCVLPNTIHHITCARVLPNATHPLGNVSICAAADQR